MDGRRGIWGDKSREMDEVGGWWEIDEGGRKRGE
jgi:hypothetical protein